MLLLPAISWGSGMAVPRSPTWQRAVLLWTPLVVTLSHYAWLNFAGRLGVLGIGVTVWYVLAAETMLSRNSVGETTLHESESPPLTRAA